MYRGVGTFVLINLHNIYISIYRVLILSSSAVLYCEIYTEFYR